jgi:hypothetical protein
MTRKGFVSIVGAIIAAAVFVQVQTGAQGAAPAKAPAQSAEPKAAPLGHPSGVPDYPPTQQPTSGPAELPKAPAASLGSVVIPKKVMADGKPLSAGTYMLRLTDETGSPVVGQTQAETRWVEFLQGGKVMGRELATVLSASEAKAIAKTGLPPAGSALIQTLVGNDYLRLWINKGGTNYLVHLST